MFTMYLEAVGNPDHMQDPNSYVADPEVVEGESIDEIVKKAKEWMNYYGIGSGNWTGGEIYNGDVLVGYMSYNGRVWCDKY